MHHFRDALRGDGANVHYHALSADPADDRGASFAALLREDVPSLGAQRLVVVEPGDWPVRRNLLADADELDVTLDIRADRHFYCDTEPFHHWAEGRKILVLEHFYREMRRRHEVLMEDGDPVGGAWNFDIVTKAARRGIVGCSFR